MAREVIAVKVVAFKLPEELLKELDLYAMNHRLYRSEAIRLAIEKLLKEANEGVRNG